MSRLQSSPNNKPTRPPERTLVEKVAWVERHSPKHAAALNRIVDITIASIDAMDLRAVKRARKRAS